MPLALHQRAVIVPSWAASLAQLPAIEQSAAQLFATIPATAFLATDEEPPMSEAEYRGYHERQMLWLALVVEADVEAADADRGEENDRKEDDKTEPGTRGLKGENVLPHGGQNQKSTLQVMSSKCGTDHCDDPREVHKSAVVAGFLAASWQSDGDYIDDDDDVPENGDKTEEEPNNLEQQVQCQRRRRRRRRRQRQRQRLHLHVDEVGVRQEWQGCGLATRLMHHVVGVARDSARAGERKNASSKAGSGSGSDSGSGSGWGSSPARTTESNTCSTTSSSTTTNSGGGGGGGGTARVTLTTSRLTPWTYDWYRRFGFRDISPPLSCPSSSSSVFSCTHPFCSCPSSSSSSSSSAGFYFPSFEAREPALVRMLQTERRRWPGDFGESRVAMQLDLDLGKL